MSTIQTDILSSSSSAPPPSPKWTYDVFLSFRGKDTRKSFTDHLYTALMQKGIFTFRDDEELERGEAIAPNLLKAIEQSRYVIVVLSKNYANSSWCLDEVAKIVECMKLMRQTVLPVFYHVDPFEVRRQTGIFEEAFCKHEGRYKDNIEKVQKWRAALFEVSNLSGWHVQDRYESIVIQGLVGKIFVELNQTIPSLSKDLVGMESHMKNMLSVMEIGLPDVRIIGIWGMGGIGKTTIAQEVSKRVRAGFEGYSFLANVREEFEKQGAVHLQKQLLSDLLRNNVNVQNIDMEEVLCVRLRTKMVLIVLDDVNQLEELEALCDRTWFGSGSRIIITSRNEHLLNGFGVDKIYQVNTLTDDEALQLFSLKAFKKDVVEEDFLNLSMKFLKYANGLPLAIKVLGSSLHGRSLKLWSSTLDRLKENPEKKIIDVLKVSFDGLRETEKKTFLDIACFFEGEDKDRVTGVLESRGYCPDIDIEVLMEKSLVTLFGRKLRMHDLIQELGWEIVRQECREDACKRSRLWLPKDIIHLLENNEGTTTVEAILLSLPKHIHQKVQMDVDPFSKMYKLRLLKISNVYFSGNVKFLSNELQFLEWHACPLNSFPPNFQSDKLVEISMHSSRLKQLWNGNESWSMLKSIDLSFSQYLIKTPNFTKVPNLEMLVLEGCKKLVEVHPSIGFLRKLVLLNMENCESIESLPPFIRLESLQRFTLSGCLKLKRFPEIEGNMKSLLELQLGGIAIEELPPSIECLSGLTLLNLSYCRNLLRLPCTIQFLTSLKSLILTGCSELDHIPENLKCVECLEELDISGTAIRGSSFIVGMNNLKYLSFRGCKDQPTKPWYSFLDYLWGGKSHVPRSLLLPASMSSLTSLTELDLSNCNLMDGSIPNGLGSLFSLKTLKLSDNNFILLPESISQLSKLTVLHLNNCSRLQSLPKLPLSVRHVDAKDCTSLKDFPNQYKVWTSCVSAMTTVNSLISPKNQQPCTSVQSDFFSLLDYRSTPLQAVLHRTEIPELFSHLAAGNFLAIPLPPELSEDGKWVGIAVVFLVKRHPGLSNIESESEASNYFYRFDIGSREFQLKPNLISDWRLRHMFVGTSFDNFLCVFYVPCLMFPKMLNESTVIGAIFQTNNPCMEVQTCGMRLIYEQEVPRFIQTFIPFSIGHQHEIPSHVDKATLESGWFNLVDNILRWEKSIPQSQEASTVLLRRNIESVLPRYFERKPGIGHQHEIPSHVDKATLESGWFNLVDNILRWEKSIPQSQEASTVLLRRNIESVLPRYFEGLNHQLKVYDFFVRGSPAWFNPQVGTSASISLPHNLLKSKKWMGFVACMYVDRHKLVKDIYYLHFELQREDFRSLPLQLFNVSRYNTFDSDLLVVFIPRAQIPEDFTTSSQIRISFLRTDSPDYVEVQTCGLRILYQEDLQSFVQVIIQCILRCSPTVFGYYNQLVVEDWLDFKRFPERHDRKFSTDIESPPLQFSQYLRDRDWSADMFNLKFPGIEIPKWFMHPNKGNYAQLQLPPNIFNDDNWIGIAVCSSLSIHKHPNILLDTPAAQYTHELLFCLNNDVGNAPTRLRTYIKESMWLHECDFTWFNYVARSIFPDSWNQSNRIDATVESNNPCIGKHGCALRLVFKEDVEELVQMLNLCESSQKCSHCEEALKNGHRQGRAITG